MGTTNSMLGCNPAGGIQLQALWPAWHTSPYSNASVSFYLGHVKCTKMMTFLSKQILCFKLFIDSLFTVVLIVHCKFNF